MRKNRRVTSTNKNAHITSRIDRTGKFRTETTRRDNGELDIAVSTDRRTGTTRLFIDEMGREGNFGGLATLTLNGRQARTLFQALLKHYNETGAPSAW